MKVWAIKKWNATFEDHNSRKLRTLSYGQLPLDQGSLRFKRLMQDMPGAAAYGHFMAIVTIAAQLPYRGLLFRSDKAMSVVDVAAMIGIPAGPLKRSWRVLTEEVQWIVEVEIDPSKLKVKYPYDGDENSRESPENLPETSRSSPAALPPISRLTEQNRTEQKLTKQGPPEQSAPIAAIGPGGIVREMGTALPACQTVRDALVACGVGEPALSQLAILPGLTVEEIRREWKSITDAANRKRPILNPPSVLVRSIQTAHGVKLKPKAHIGSVMAQQVPSLRQLRKDRAVGGGVQ